jgi:hypothetical protein
MYGADGRIPAAVRILASQSDETDKKHFILFPQKSETRNDNSSDINISAMLWREDTLSRKF